MNLQYFVSKDTLVITLKRDEIERFLMVGRFLAGDARVTNIISVPPTEFFEKIEASQEEMMDVKFPSEYLNFGATILKQFSIALVAEGRDNSRIEEFLEEVSEQCVGRPVLH